MPASTRHVRRLSAVVVVLGLLPAGLHAQSVRGKVSVETRIFPNGPAFPDQRHATASPSLALEPELLGEVMLDGRDTSAPFIAFDNDVFMGARWAFNDTADTSVLGGPIVDYETGEVIAFLEWERRFGDRWIAGLEGRWLLNTDRQAPLHGLRQDDFITVQLSRYF